MPKPSTLSVSSTEQRLDQIVSILERMNKRDKLRTWGGFVRGILHLIPIVILIGSVWFTYAHWDEVLTQITKAAAEQSAAMMRQSAGELQRMVGL
ncbi:hypothetical protein FJZ27_03165 [Candidatus Peribacteria bacterium]|nr:hypothetical protein [Candidatus Peribacteria bacterium]